MERKPPDKDQMIVGLLQNGKAAHHNTCLSSKEPRQLDVVILELRVMVERIQVDISEEARRCWTWVNGKARDRWRGQLVAFSLHCMSGGAVKPTRGEGRRTGRCAFSANMIIKDAHVWAEKSGKEEGSGRMKGELC